MAFLARLVIALGGGLATLLISRDAANFEVVQAMLGIAVSVAILAVFALLSRR